MIPVTQTGCPSSVAVVALGGNDLHVLGCQRCHAVWESVERAETHGHTMMTTLDCERSRALMEAHAGRDEPSLETLVNLASHFRQCAACRGLALRPTDTPMPTSILPPEAAPSLPSERSRPNKEGGTIGRFKITGTLGEGGMGVVLAAHDPDLDRPVAIKLVHGEMHGKHAEELTIRMLREAQAMAKISHPNVITVYEVGRVDDQIYIAMERIQGTTLTKRLAKVKHSWRDIVKYFRAAGEGLAAAHAAGLIHRDFKPDNVLVSDTGEVYVMDFGLVVAHGTKDMVSSLPAAPDLRKSSPVFESMTRTGAVMGTPKYMAPEQHLAQPTDARSDQFSFCVALYEALYGTAPFVGRTYTELAYNITNEIMAPLPKNAPQVPERIRAILLRGLATDPAKRFGSMKELLAKLDAITAKRHTALFVALGGAIIIASAAVTFAVTRSHVAPQAPVCEGGEQEISGVWNPETQRAVRESFLGTGAPYAKDVVARIDAPIASYRSEWVAMYTDACKATRLFHSQSEEMLDRRMSCLDRRRQELASMAALWKKADREIVANALTSISRLPAINDCSAALSAEAETNDPAKAKQLVALRGQLATTNTLLHAGKYREGLHAAEELRTGAETLGVPQFTAETLNALGELQWRTGDMGHSVDTLEQAYDLAETAGASSWKARTAIQLTYVHASELEDFAEARKWSGRAEASLKNIGGNRALEAELLRAVGIADNKSGHYEKSLQSFRKALELRQGLQNQLEIALALADVAVPLIGMEKTDEAIDSLTKAIAIVERELGKEHPELGDLYNNLGVAYASAGQRDRAREYYKRSLELQEAAFGPDYVKLADVLTNIGALAAADNDYDTAAADISRAAALEEKGLGPNNPSLAVTLTHLANVRAAQNANEEALNLARRAIAIHRQQKHPNVVDALTIAASSAFELAKKRWPAQPASAIELAREAQADIKEAGSEPELAEDIATWLKQRAK